MAIAARICPNDVRLTLEQAIPGGMCLEDYSLMREVIAASGRLFAHARSDCCYQGDYSLMREVIAAIREGLPDADQCSLVRYFNMC